MFGFLPGSPWPCEDHVWRSNRRLGLRIRRRRVLCETSFITSSSFHFGNFFNSIFTARRCASAVLSCGCVCPSVHHKSQFDQDANTVIHELGKTSTNAHHYDQRRYAGNRTAPPQLFNGCQHITSQSRPRPRRHHLICSLERRTRRPFNASPTTKHSPENTRDFPP